MANQWQACDRFSIKMLDPCGIWRDPCLFASAFHLIDLLCSYDNYRINQVYLYNKLSWACWSWPHEILIIYKMQYLEDNLACDYKHYNFSWGIPFFRMIVAEDVCFIPPGFLQHVSLQISLGCWIVQFYFDLVQSAWEKMFCTIWNQVLDCCLFLRHLMCQYLRQLSDTWEVSWQLMHSLVMR